MVLLPHSAFVGLEGFFLLESAKILHDYHNVPLKNASSMITATRNYIQCTMFVSIMCNCWFSHDVTKFQTLELLIFLRFYFHDLLEQLKNNIHTNFHSEWVLGLVIDCAWISKLLRGVTFTWRARELLCWFKRWLVSGNSAIWTVLVLE